jgi:hypothetical protein
MGGTIAPAQGAVFRAIGVSFWNSDGGESIDGVATIAALGRSYARSTPHIRRRRGYPAGAVQLAFPGMGGQPKCTKHRTDFRNSQGEPGAGSSEPPSAAVLDPLTVQAVLGRDVRSVADENMGRIVDVIVDRSGQVRAAVIDFGGFLGVGSRKIAVDWGILRFGPGEKPDRVVVDLTRAQVKAAPEYKDGKPVVVLGASAAMPPAEPDPASPR